MTSADLDLTHATPAEVRSLIRRGAYTGPTSGLCLGHLQANVAILPAEAAGEFRAFCEANSRPMPLVDVTAPGDPEPAHVAPGADLRTDVPRYRVYRSGEVAGEVTDIRDLWEDDFVGFLLGCSFSAENRLLEAGVRLRHLEAGRNVPMFVTSVPCTPVGRFHGPVVVSMRPIRRDQVELASRVTGELPLAHGAPVNVGEPEKLGIRDLAHPDFGDAVVPTDGEVPVFWACGVTPQAVLMEVKPPLAITHAPGHMFIADTPECDIAGRRTLA
ncbi:MAG: putative hydro-lyase [Candidatus Dormibacteraeota bacterium]|nr:putative hydro-lyase [Candidatus Dormibacteraeota bacterium]MBO0743437.1 putative hydro-lyase [Candidatus Dormibacteraeota bacterium]